VIPPRLKKRFWRRERQEEVGATSFPSPYRFQESKWEMDGWMHASSWDAWQKLLKSDNPRYKR
jgi:hypothetical protein